MKQAPRPVPIRTGGGAPVGGMGFIVVVEMIRFGVTRLLCGGNEWCFPS